jgi:hypothetical protein
MITTTTRDPVTTRNAIDQPTRSAAGSSRNSRRSLLSSTHHVWFQAFAGCCALTVYSAAVWRLRANFTEHALARASGRAR